MLPAYSLAEPHEKLIRQKTQRRVLYDSIDLEFNQLKRNSNYVDHINSIKDKLLFLLIQSNEEEERRFRDYLKKLTAIADIIPLTAEILNSANEQRFDLKPQDAIIYSSVIAHLEDSDQENSCFLNRNSKDFSKNPDIVEQLKKYNCTVIPHFDDGYKHINANLKKKTDSFRMVSFLKNLKRKWLKYRQS